MNEEEWKESVDVEKMLECLVQRRFPEAEPCDWKRGERKKRLFVLACLNRIWFLLPAEFKAVCKLLEPEVDTQISREQREGIWDAAEGISEEHDNLLFALGYDDIGLLCYFASGMAARGNNEEGVSDQAMEFRRQHEQREQASLLRDVFGNPFQSISVDPGWITPEAIRLASTIYENRAFKRLPELADALEAAGCHSAEILEHCHGAELHVRGCWLVDMLLGKE